jgi:hypothetical protein
MLGPDVDLRFTAYDVAGVAEQIRATGFPDAEMQAALIAKPSPAEEAARWFS